MHDHTDDTRVDRWRPTSSESAEPGEVTQDAPPELDMDFGDEEDTVLLSRLAWPEPPRSLGERQSVARNDGTALARSLPGAQQVQRLAFWQGLFGAVIVAASISIFIPRLRSRSAAPPTITYAHTRTTAAPPEPASVSLPPLFVNVETESSASTRQTAPASSKPPIEVSKLPVAARTPVSPPRNKRPSKPQSRPKPAATSAVGTAGERGSMFAAGTAIDDGF